MALVRVAGESLGDMTWRVYKDEVIKRVMISIKRGLKEERDSLEEFLEDKKLFYGEVREYIEGKIEELDEYCGVFRADNAMETAKKDLEDFPKEKRERIGDLLILSAKRLARRSSIAGEI